MQYSNEELTAMIQAGEREYLPRLWDQVQAFVRSEAARWLRAWRKNRPSLEFDDLYQCGYIALCEAVKTYHAGENMTFISWLSFYLKTEFGREIGCRTSKQRRERETLTLSLDAPMGGDTEEITLGDAVADPEDKYASVETAVYQEQLKVVVGKALDELPQTRREVLQMRYYDRLTLAEIGGKIGISKEQVRQREEKGLRALRKGRAAADLREAYYGDRNYYRGTGFHSWLRHGCSAPEWELIRREEWERRQFQA